MCVIVAAVVTLVWLWWWLTDVNVSAPREVIMSAVDGGDPILANINSSSQKNLHEVGEMLRDLAGLRSVERARSSVTGNPQDGVITIWFQVGANPVLVNMTVHGNAISYWRTDIRGRDTGDVCATVDPVEVRRFLGRWKVLLGLESGQAGKRAPGKNP